MPRYSTLSEVLINCKYHIHYSREGRAIKDYYWFSSFDLTGIAVLEIPEDQRWLRHTIYSLDLQEEIKDHFLKNYITQFFEAFAVRAQLGNIDKALEKLFEQRGLTVDPLIHVSNQVPLISLRVETRIFLLAAISQDKAWLAVI